MATALLERRTLTGADLDAVLAAYTIPVRPVLAWWRDETIQQLPPLI